MPNSFDLGSEFNTVGVFWDPVHADDRFSGQIVTDDRKIELTSAAELISVSLDSVSFPAEAPPAGPDLLDGLTALGACTLLGPYHAGAIGLQHVPEGWGIRAKKYRVNACLVGVHLESPSAAVFNEALFRYSGLGGWLGSPAQPSFTDEGISVFYPKQVPPLLSCRVDSLNAQLTIKVTPGLRYTPGGKHHAHPEPLVIMQSDQPRDLEWFIEIAVRLEHFFSMCLGTSVALKTLRLTTDAKKTAWLIQRRRAEWQKGNIALQIKAYVPEFQAAVVNWLDAGETLQPIETLLYETLRRSDLFVETEFVALAQAVESFHRVTAPSKKGATFRERMNDLLRRPSAEAVQKVVGDTRTFEQTLRETRNYFTHPGIEKKARVLVDAKELFLFNQRLHAFLRLLLLLQVGFAEERVLDAVYQRAERWR